MIPTAEEFFRKFKHTHSPINHHLALIEFAKMHVEEALKEAEIAGQTNWGNSKKMKDAILNAYPLNLIK